MATHSEAGKLGYQKTREKLQGCRAQQVTIARERHDAAKPRCPACNSLIAYEKRRKRFCSHSCAASINNRGVVRNGSKRRTHCARCQQPIKSTGVLYCSRECSHAHRAEKFAQKVLSGSAEIGSGSSRAVRKCLIQLRGECCEECGWARRHPVTGNIPLELDHRDGNAENNSLSNLKLLCPACHALTPNFRNLNRGNGRASRRKAPE